MEPRTSMDFQDYIPILWRRKWVIVLSISVVMLTGLILYSLKPQIYRATSLVIIENRGVEVMLQTHPHILPRFVSLAAREIIIKSLDFAKELSTEIPLSPEEIRSAISTNSILESQVLEITARHNNPEMAKKISNNAAAHFVEYSKRAISREAIEAKKFLAERLTETKQEMLNADKAFQQFKSQKGVFDLEKEMGELTTYITKLTADEHDTQQQLKANQIRITTHHGIARQKEIDKKVAELNSLQARYTSIHPKVVALKENIQVIGYNPEPTTTTGDTFLRELLAEGRTLEDRLLKIASEKKAVQVRLKYLASNGLQYAELQRKYTTTKETHDGILKSLDDTKMRESMTVGDARAVELAGKAFPINKTGLKNFFFLISLGLVLGFGSTLFVEYIDNTIKTSDEVKRHLNVPVLGVIPRLEKETSPILLQAGTKSTLNEAYQALVFSLEQVTLKMGCKGILVASAKEGEGKTTIASNIAISMARNGEKVILIDGDLRRPRIHQIFNLDNSVGLSTLLRGDLEAERGLRSLKEHGSFGSKHLVLEEQDVANILKPTEVEGLSVITSGPVPSNPVELLKSDNLKRLFGILKNYANLIIYDTPPANLVVDSLVLSTTLDGAIFILESGRVTRKEAAEVKNLLEMSGINLLGTIINSSQIERKGYYYYYQYYSTYPAPHSTKKKRKRS